MERNLNFLAEFVKTRLQEKVLFLPKTNRPNPSLDPNTYYSALLAVCGTEDDAFKEKS